jgi:hypothetical protein
MLQISRINGILTKLVNEFLLPKNIKMKIHLRHQKCFENMGHGKISKFDKNFVAYIFKE